MGDEGLVLIYFLRRKVRECDGPAVANDEVDFLPATWTCGMMAPPSCQASHAKLMAAFESSEVFLGHCQANGALGRAGLRFLDLLHPARHSGVDDVLSPLRSHMPLSPAPVPELRHALLGVIGGPPTLTSLSLAKHLSFESIISLAWVAS